MINIVREWLRDNQARFDGKTAQISVILPTQNQVKKSIVIDFNSPMYSGTFICWESGECDVDVASLGNDSSVPLEKCISSVHYRLKGKEQVHQALETFFSTVWENEGSEARAERSPQQAPG